MARMIDVDALIKAMGVKTYMQTEWTPATAWGVPIVDAEPVVRCKDCRYYRIYWDSNRYTENGYGVCDWINYSSVKEDHFCSWGERRENEAN